MVRAVSFLAWVGISCGAIYALAGLAAAYGMWRLPRARQIAESALPRVSVLVSARNEQRDLPRCIAALAALDYPADRLEVWLVDDRSDDQTAQILEAACAQHPNFHKLSTAGFETRLEAKARGIALAAAHATGEWLFITDADAVVHPLWLRTMLGRADDGVGLLAGAYVVELGSFVGLLERATSLAAIGISFGAEGLLGAEIVPLGPNMAIRRDVYEAQGGLASVAFRVAEDIALWQLGQRAGMRVRAVLEPEATVTLTPVPTLKHMFSQQRRWLVGGFGDGPPHIRRVSIGVALFALIGTASVYAACASALPLGFAGFGLLGVSQIFTMTALRQRLRLSSVWRIVPVALVYTSALFVWLPLTAFLLPGVYWRGDGYEVRLA
jgi:cellulose synthase/poly-beta-1,6-N-acetylglucosamine synthase-like glycosyltransferase